MKLRGLRIAWSVVWGLACVLIVALWMRSYWRLDVVTHHTNADGLEIRAVRGAIRVQTIEYVVVNPSTGWFFDRYSMRELEASYLRETGRLPSESDLLRVNTRFIHSYFLSGEHVASDWLLLIAAAGFAAMPWFTYLRRGFQRRTRVARPDKSA